MQRSQVNGAATCSSEAVESTSIKPQLVTVIVEDEDCQSELAATKFNESRNLNLSLSSLGSMSVYSEAGGKGKYDITGEVLVGVYYKNSQLHIHVERARGLAAADSNGYSNPYIKTYLLPDKAKHTKQKTSIKKKTLEPVYNEELFVSLSLFFIRLFRMFFPIFVQYHISKSEFGSRTLLVTVWDWNKFGKNQFLGEIRLPLSSLELIDSSNQPGLWYPLQDKVCRPVHLELIFIQKEGVALVIVLRGGGGGGGGGGHGGDVEGGAKLQ